MLLALPQETVNEIIARLRSEKRALQSLSVVAKRLTDECRRYLFASVHIDSGARLARWCDTIAPREDGLSRHVRLLDLDTWTDGSWCTPTLLRELGVHLRSFTRVEQLKICPLDLRTQGTKDLMDSLDRLTSTVRSVYIRPRGDFLDILNFLALFPHLETTLITSPLIYEDQEVTAIPNLVCRGDLILKVCRIGNDMNILSYLTRPTARYRRLGLGLVKVDNPAPMQRFFETCGGSLESIRFISCFFGPLVHCPPTLLSPLTELQDIKLSLRFYNDYFDVLTILSSITSTRISSVTLFVWECPFPHDIENFSLRWLEIENALCRLWELKKGAESTGGVVLNVHFDDEGIANEVLRLSGGGEFLSRFREGGVVNVGTQPVDSNRAMSSIMPEGFS